MLQHRECSDPSSLLEQYQCPSSRQELELVPWKLHDKTMLDSASKIFCSCCTLPHTLVSPQHQWL